MARVDQLRTYYLEMLRFQPQFVTRLIVIEMGRVARGLDVRQKVVNVHQ